MLKTTTNRPRLIRLFRLPIAAVLIVSTLLSLMHGGVVSAVAVIQATKTDALLIDADNNGQVSPGDTLRYTVTIQNTGNQDATNAVFNDTIDSNT
ncbi:MAG: hypothetical protein ACJ8CR_15985, partial [Roseiflexaceae bacterium]